MRLSQTGRAATAGKFIQAVNLAAYQSAVMESIVEKDYYVIMILRLLAKKVPFAVFKGGTSLSKCCRAILRFSEDIDIAADVSLSQGQKSKLKNTIIEELKSAEQMKWIGLMNNVRSAAEEIVLRELVYV